jgi:3-hydroxy-3-methylglutaryl CoA synthase
VIEVSDISASVGANATSISEGLEFAEEEWNDIRALVVARDIARAKSFFFIDFKRDFLRCGLFGRIW